MSKSIEHLIAIFLLILQLVNRNCLEKVKAHPEMHTKQRHSAGLEEEIRHARRGQAFEVRDLYWINYSQLPLTVSNGRGIQPSNGQRFLKIQSRS